MRVVVLGAGLIGVTTAWYLAERGHEVEVVDRQSAPGRGGELRQWLPGHAQHLRQLGGPGHAAQDPALARSAKTRPCCCGRAPCPAWSAGACASCANARRMRWRANTRATYGLAMASLDALQPPRRDPGPGIRSQPARPDQAVPRPAVDGQCGQGQPSLCRARPPPGLAGSGRVRRARSRRWRRSPSGSPAASSTRPTRAATPTASPAPWPSAAPSVASTFRHGIEVRGFDRNGRRATALTHRRGSNPRRRLRAGGRGRERAARAQARPAAAGLPGQGLLDHGPAPRLEPGAAPARRRRRPQGRVHATGRPHPGGRNGRVRRLEHQPEPDPLPHARGRAARRPSRTAASGRARCSNGRACDR